MAFFLGPKVSMFDGMLLQCVLCFFRLTALRDFQQLNIRLDKVLDNKKWLDRVRGFRDVALEGVKIVHVC